jgi:hypothetical protein
MEMSTRYSATLSSGGGCEVGVGVGVGVAVGAGEGVGEGLSAAVVLFEEVSIGIGCGPVHPESNNIKTTMTLMTVLKAILFFLLTIGTPSSLPQ